MTYPEKRHIEASQKILELINSPIFQVECLILRPCFIICGVSGSGKTSAITLANQQLPEDSEIAESMDILFCRDAKSAEQIINDDKSRYHGARYIAYTTVYKTIGQELANSTPYRVIFVE